MATIFDEANGLFTRDLIEYYFGGRDSDEHWEGDEFYCLNPLRNDATIGSFSISSTKKCYSDFASKDKGGDLVQLLALMQNKSPIAVAKELTGAITTSYPKTKEQQVEAIYPITQSMFALAEKQLKDKTNYHSRSMGIMSNAWIYKDANGQPLMACVRYSGKKIADKKEIRYYYYSRDGWQTGQALKSNRWLFNLDLIAQNPTLPILVVEGEKCASIQVDGYLLTTWPAGANSTAKADWSPIIDRTVYIWPDNDDVGFEAAKKIKKLVPNAQILNIDRKKPQGYDLADAVDEGLDIQKLIEHYKNDVTLSLSPVVNKPANEEPVIDNQEWPFIPLGYSDRYFIFYIKQEGCVIELPKLSITSSQIGYLAPLSFWHQFHLVNEKTGNAKTLPIINWLAEQSRKCDRWRNKEVWGAGFIKSHDTIIANDGKQIIYQDGTTKNYQELLPKDVFVESDQSFYNLIGNEATDINGLELNAYITSLNLGEPWMAYALMGWILSAPFCGITSWRTHLWLTGPRGCGKSFIIDELIKPMIEPFVVKQNGTITEAALRGIIRLDSKPTLIDETEADSEHSTKRLQSIMELIKNSSSNSSENTARATKDNGIIYFRIRSVFCCASIRPPDFDAAMQSRFLKIELLKREPSAIFNEKQHHYITSLGQAFTRRFFSRIDIIMDDISFLRLILKDLLGGDREADSWAPLLVFNYHACFNKPLKEAWLTPSVQDWWQITANSIEHSTSEQESDEELILKAILNIRMKDSINTITILKAINSIEGKPLIEHLNLQNRSYEEGDEKIKHTHYLLASYGLRLITLNEKTYLVIAINKGILKDELKAHGYAKYGPILARHDAVYWRNEDKKPVNQRFFSEGQAKSILLDFDYIEKNYL